eukprot:150166-Pyramimonas_sp.AAC.1
MMMRRSNCPSVPGAASSPSVAGGTRRLLLAQAADREERRPRRPRRASSAARVRVLPEVAPGSWWALEAA